MAANKFLQRIDKFCADRGLTRDQLAKELDVHPGIFQKVESGNRQSGIQLISRLNEVFDLSLDELLYTGFRSYYPAENSSLIPVVNVSAFADYLEHHEDAEYIRELGYYRIPGYEKGDYRIFEVDGSSMSPTIENGDYVICRKSEGEIEENNLYVIVSKRGIVVKRLYHMQEEDENKLVLRSDNDEYDDMELKAEDLLELWRVEGKITRQFLAESQEQAQIQRLEKDLLQVKANINRLMQDQDKKNQ